MVSLSNHDGGIAANGALVQLTPGR